MIPLYGLGDSGAKIVLGSLPFEISQEQPPGEPSSSSFSKELL